MKILDLNNSFVMAMLSRKIENMVQEKFNTNATLLLSGMSANESGDSVSIDVTAKIVMSKKDVADMLFK